MINDVAQHLPSIQVKEKNRGHTYIRHIDALLTNKIHLGVTWIH